MAESGRWIQESKSDQARDRPASEAGLDLKIAHVKNVRRLPLQLLDRLVVTPPALERGQGDSEFIADHSGGCAVQEFARRLVKDTQNAMGLAISWMTEYLADVGEARRKDLFADGEVQGHSSSTLERALDQLCKRNVVEKPARGTYRLAKNDRDVTTEVGS